MASKSSWRLKFIDIDTSFSIKTEPGIIKGYMVVRAPKGETEPYFFEKNNQQAIEAYVGLGGSDYPDIEEAIAFNREYGLYISAPAGTHSEHPSYIGGKYLTTEGIVDFYNVENRDNIDFTKSVQFTDLAKDPEDVKVTFIPRLFNAEDADTFTPETTEMYSIAITGISAEKFSTLKEIAVNYQGISAKGNTPAGTYYYQIDKKSHRLYCELEDGELSPTYSGIYSKDALGNYIIVLGGSNWLLDSANKYNTVPVLTEYSSIIEAVKGKVYKDQSEVGASTYKFNPEGNSDGRSIDFTMTISNQSVFNFTITFEDITKFSNGKATLIGKEDPYTKEAVYSYNIKTTGVSAVFNIKDEVEGYPATLQFTIDSSTSVVTSEKGRFIDNIINAVKTDQIVGSTNSSSNNDYTNSGVPFFNLQNISPKLEEYIFDKDTPAKAQDLSLLAGYIIGNGDMPFPFEGSIYMETNDDGTMSSYEINSFAFDPYTYLSFLLDISSNTFGMIYQKSPSEKQTTIKLLNIGYDKWKYDIAMPLFNGTLDGLSTEKSTDSTIFKTLVDTKYVAVGVYKNTTELQEITIYQVDSDKLTDTEIKSYNEALTEVTENFMTQHVLISKVFNAEEVISSHDAFAQILYIESKKGIYVEQDPSDKNSIGKKYFLQKDNNFNTYTFSVAEEVYSKTELTSGGTFTGSIDPNGTDSYGANIYWPNVLNENDFSFVEVGLASNKASFEAIAPELYVNGIFIGERIVDDTLQFDLEGNLTSKVYEDIIHGERYVSWLVEDNKAQDKIGGAWRDEFMPIISQGWTEATDANYDDVYVFMEPTGREQLKTSLSSLVEGTHKLAIAISAKNLTKQEVERPSTIIVTARNKQHAQFCGEFMQYDSKTGKNFYTCPIGDIGKMCCRIFDKKMGGWAPAWYNYNSMGGQLDRAVLKAKYNFSDPATEVLDHKGLNPIVFNADDGLMIVSSKTTQDPNNETDWSFLEHVMSFVLLKREIRDNVMRPQIKKPIDDYWMEVRQTQVDAILDKRIVGPNKIWSQATCNIKGVNNETTKAQRKFCILVKVKTIKFAETVELTLETVGETVNL